MSARGSMRKLVRGRVAPALALALAWSLLYVPSSVAEETPITPTELVERGRELDGTEIVVTGEVLGEDMYAGKTHRWVNIAGDGTAVGLWMEHAFVEPIEHFGRYGVRGDALTVRGILNVACEQHEGEFDVHVSEVLSREPGEVREKDVDWWKLGVGLAGIAIGVAEYQLYRSRRDRLRP